MWHSAFFKFFTTLRNYTKFKQRTHKTDMIQVLWISLAGLAVWFAIVLTRDFLAHRNSLENSSCLKTSVIGFVTNFFDVLGRPAPT